MRTGVSVLAATSSLLAAPNPASASSALYEKAVGILRERYFDKTFRDGNLDSLAQRYRPCAEKAQSIGGQRDCLTQLLAHMPASHLAVISEASFRYLLAELTGAAQPTLGLLALERDGQYFTAFVLEGGPAAEAGIFPWERIVSIDGKPIAQSPRLDYRQKDAYLSIQRDPPLHLILCHDGEEVTLGLERKPGEERMAKLRTRPYSALTAAKASARLTLIDGHALGYVHFWFIHSSGVLELLRELFDGRFAHAEGLIFDLRGRGGSGAIVEQLLKLLSDFGRPIVALTDRQSRSAKDALAYEFKQRHLARVVGERTAGAVIPASFASLGDETMLMFPSFTLGEYTEKLELKGGVEPDVPVERAGPYAGGQDPILDAGTNELLLMVKAAPPITPHPRVEKPATPPVVSSTLANRPLPSIETIVAKMVEALGGEKTLRAHKYRMLTGTTEFIGLPLKGDFKQRASAPDKSLIEMNLGDLVVKQGFDGKTAWTKTSMDGLQILQGEAADGLRQQARFYGPLDLRATNREVTPIARTMFDGKECFELKVVGPNGGVSKLYVNSETHLPAGMKATNETPIGKVESTTYLRDYKTFDGFKTATEIYLESSVQRQSIKIDEVKFEPIDPSVYAVPEKTR